MKIDFGASAMPFPSAIRLGLLLAVLAGSSAPAGSSGAANPALRNKMLRRADHSDSGLLPCRAPPNSGAGDARQGLPGLSAITLRNCAATGGVRGLSAGVGLGKGCLRGGGISEEMDIALFGGMVDTIAHGCGPLPENFSMESI